MTAATLNFSNPVIKDEIEILFESKEKLVFRTVLKPSGGQAGVHYHTKITEEFKIISGELTVNLNEQKLTLKSGDHYVIKPFDCHRFLNESKNNVVFEVVVTPSIDIKRGLQVIYGLATEDKVYKNGLPKNLLSAAIAIQMMDAYVPKIPLSIQKIGIGVLAFLGKKTAVKRKLISRYC
ncbi:cupin domain-containing protein [Flavobacterium frigidarium]|jgi:quercetin dioxygenase-like cupin family protein|uniref:Cupin domain-containing protein n=1 Tax=Flavobacterium frigidarium TaxID=99286 RepID=A0ABV4KAA2_9FLAO